MDGDMKERRQMGLKTRRFSRKARNKLDIVKIIRLLLCNDYYDTRCY